MKITYDSRTESVILQDTAPVVPPVVVPPVVTPLVTTQQVNMAKVLMSTGLMAYPNRYDRQQTVVIRGAQASIAFITCNFDAGGTAVPFGVDAVLTLTLDGERVATKQVVAADTGVTFLADLSHLLGRWYFASVTGLDPTWSVLAYGVYLYVPFSMSSMSGAMPVSTGSYDMVNSGRYQTARVPAKFEPTVVPYPARLFPDHPAIPARKDIIITSLAPPRHGDQYRPALTKEGVLTTANRQNYYYYDFEQPRQFLPVLDGPRGKGTIIAPVHLEVGSATPNGALLGNVYFIESWRIGKVTPDGTVKTLAGYRHKDIATYWQDPSQAELVGDWSSIPAARRGFAQPWGMAWDQRTLVIDDKAAPIADQGNLQPHVLAPVLFVSDTYRNRILKLTFSATAHGVPPKVEEFITGLNQPWSVIADGTQLWVSDRMNNAIKRFDMDAGELRQTLGAVQPEGMVLQDGFLYYGSVKSKSIRKIELATGKDVLVADQSTPGSGMGYHINGNSRYVQLAISDGSFGPRGMIAYTTWSNSYFGYPILLDPSGKMIDWIAGTGKGIVSPALGTYATAVGIGHGRMLFGSVEDGLHVASEALPTDPVVDQAKYKAGQDQWQAKGYGLTHGPGGYGHYGLALPWGVTPEIDYMLTANGHTP